MSGVLAAFGILSGLYHGFFGPAKEEGATRVGDDQPAIAQINVQVRESGCRRGGASRDLSEAHTDPLPTLSRTWRAAASCHLSRCPRGSLLPLPRRRPRCVVEDSRRSTAT